MNMITKPNIEALKEVLRWGVLFGSSWLITEMLTQASSIPEFYKLDVWVFAFMIPVRTMIVFVLTIVGRYVDKFLFEKSKANPDQETKGLLPF